VADALICEANELLFFSAERNESEKKQTNG